MNIGKILVCTLFVSLNLLAGNSSADSSVWKISKDKNYFYLGATIHLLSKDDYPLPDEFSKAFADATVVFFETDLVAAQTPEFQSKLFAAMTYGDNRTLAGELDPEVYSQLEAFMESRNLQIANFSKFQPWGVSLMITMLEYQRLGLMPDYGVDIYFNRLAQAENKKIMSLETPEAQLSFLASMTDIAPDKGIEYTLKDLGRLPDFVDKMKENWRSGNLDELADSSFVVEMKQEFPEIYQTIVTNRNQVWMSQLTQLTDDSDKEFVLVGAMHLQGKEGLLNQLKTQGFMVEQL